MINTLDPDGAFLRVDYVAFVMGIAGAYSTKVEPFANNLMIASITDGRQVIVCP